MRRLARAFITAVCVHFSAASSVLAQQVVDERQIQAFHLAVKANDFSFIARMDKLGLGPSTRDSLGNDLLMIAIRDDGPQMALIMLDQPEWRTKEIINFENQLGENALMLASLKGQKAVAQRLIELGAEVNRAGWSPLHYAATSGHVDVIELLLEHHAFIDAGSPNGTTPLMMAARFNHTEAARKLLQAGADPTLVNGADMTAKNYAQEGNNKDLAFWFELEEISFKNRNLNSPIDLNSSSNLPEIVIESGGSVVIEGEKAPTSDSSFTVREVRPGDSNEVEVFEGVR